MFRTMVFIDQLNFYISSKKYYTSLGLDMPKLDYTKIPIEIAKRIPDAKLVKTFVFAPKPDRLLMQLPSWENYTGWLDMLNTKNYFEIIKSDYQARPTNGIIDVTDRSTYYLEEKGTDVQLAAQMLTKAFHNSLDMAVLVSGDTDYLPVLDILRTIGKLSVIAAVEGQNLMRYNGFVDEKIIMDKTFFNNCLLE